MRSTTCSFLIKYFFMVLILLQGIPASESRAAKLVDVSTLDRDYLIIHISDGDVIHQDEISKTEQVLRYTPELNTSAAVLTSSWTISSTDDSNYGGSGQNPGALLFPSLRPEQEKHHGGHKNGKGQGDRLPPGEKCRYLRPELPPGSRGSPRLQL